MTRLPLALAALAVVAGRPDDGRVADLYGGEANLAVVARPDRVTASRLERAEPLGTIPAEDAVKVGPVPVPEELARSISKALASGDSYLWDVAKGCIPSYEVRLRFERGDERIDVYLCLNCKVLAIRKGNQELGGEDFDPIFPLLLKAAQQLFPDDEPIQSLRVRD